MFSRVPPRALLILLGLCLSFGLPAHAERGAARPAKNKPALIGAKKAAAQGTTRTRPIRSRIKATFLAAKRRTAKKLGLDRAVLELTTTFETGIPGFLSVGAAPRLIFSGGKTANKKPFLFSRGGAVGLQALFATGGISYVPGTNRPIAYSVGAGPFTYRPNDPAHNVPAVSLSIPLIGSMQLGPRLLGASVALPVPWAPAFRWGGGIYLSHPRLELITGPLWRSGVWGVSKARIAIAAFKTKFPRTTKLMRKTKRKATQLKAALAARSKKVGAAAKARFPSTVALVERAAAKLNQNKAAAH